MSRRAIQDFTSIRIEDLDNPSFDQKYPLGLEIVIADTEQSFKAIKIFKYVKAHAALTQYQPYIVSASAIVGSEVITGAPFTIDDSTGIRVGVPQEAFDNGFFGFVQIEGEALALMSAETYAVDDFLELINADTTFLVDGTSGATVYTKESVAVCKEAGTAAQAVSVELIGRITNIAIA